MRQSLPKSSILRGYRAFSKVISNGRSLMVRPVRCYFVYDANGPRESVVGFTVTRNIGKSSQRNYFKRKLRESFRHQQHFLQSHNEILGSLKMIFLYVGEERFAKKGTGSRSVDSALRSILPRIQQEVFA